MAKISSTARPSSRQRSATPQDVPVAASAPGRVTRSTRSQSREPSVPPSPQQKRGKGRPKKNAAANTNAAVNKSGAVAPDLTVIDEDAAYELENDIEGEKHVDIDTLAAQQAAFEYDQTADVDALAARRASVGAMSGTTAKTSFSQEEIGELDTDVMVDVMSDLARASQQMADLLVPDNLEKRPIVRKDVRILSTKYNKMFENRLKAIGTHKESFGSTEYVQPSIVLRALLGVQTIDELPDAPWRPDIIIYRVNLTQMLRTVLVTVSGNAEITGQQYDAMSNLETHFSRAVAGQVSQPNAFYTLLSIMTQLAIIKMTYFFDEPGFEPRRIIMDTFFIRDADGSTHYKHEAIATVSYQLSAEQYEEYVDACNRHVDELASVFEELVDGQDRTSWYQSLATLRQRFSWAGFVEEVYQYYQKRRAEIDNEIARAGGRDKMIQDLAKEVENRNDAKKAEQKRQSFSRSTGTPKKGFGKRGIQALKAREKQLAAASTAPAPVAAPVAQMTQPAQAPPSNVEPPLLDDGWMNNDDDGMFDPPPQTAAQSAAKMALKNLGDFQGTQQQRNDRGLANGKKRSFIDPQPGATRVSFDDESQPTQYAAPNQNRSASQNGPYYQEAQPASSKRPHADIEEEGDDFDPTQDEGFQRDERDTAAADQRRRELPVARAPQATRFTSVNDAIPGPSAATTRASASPNKRARKNPGSTIPSMTALYTPEDHDRIPASQFRYQEARQMARHTTVMAAQKKTQQVRTPWTMEEENALIDLIGEHGEGGISYSQLKAILNDQVDETAADGLAPPLLARRSGEDMRWKARNMKETFLKGHAELPDHFDEVKLDKKAIEKLHSLGIPYEQEATRARNFTDQ